MPKTPSPDNLYLGAGSVYFDRFDSSGESTGLRHLGNVDTFEISMTVETSEKKNAMDGTKSTYAEVITGMTAELSATLTEYVPENVALAIMGEAAQFTQTATQTVTDRDFGPVDANVKFDMWYEVGALNPTVTTVKQGVATLNADAWELKAETGMIRLKSEYSGAGAAQEGTALSWSGSIPAITGSQDKFVVQAMTTGSVKGRIRYISADNQNQGPRVMVDIWSCGLNPDGAFGLITDDFGTFNIKGKVYADTTRPAGKQYFEVVYL